MISTATSMQISQVLGSASGMMPLRDSSSFGEMSYESGVTSDLDDGRDLNTLARRSEGDACESEEKQHHAHGFARKKNPTHTTQPHLWLRILGGGRSGIRCRNRSSCGRLWRVSGGLGLLLLGNTAASFVLLAAAAGARLIAADLWLVALEVLLRNELYELLCLPPHVLVLLALILIKDRSLALSRGVAVFEAHNELL
eukprot:Mycagemm_TRINITY_DN10139_c0_g1::TRINITY_DN10139_c0_g1_i1::g.5262::m.5262 type:complete len:198 gc:universal TRINITY_DN10139_c0_g1_i1:1382-789(-)